MRMGIDIRINPDRDIRCQTERRGKTVHDFNLLQGLAVECSDTELQGRKYLPVALADSGEDGILRTESAKVPL